VNIRNDDITDGNPKLTLGLIWTIILHFQVSFIKPEGDDSFLLRLQPTLRAPHEDIIAAVVTQMLG